MTHTNHLQRWGWLLITCVLIVTAGCGGSQGDSGGYYSCGGYSTVFTVQGTVVDTRNAPLPNYSVTINNGTPARTNSRGIYALEINVARLNATGNTFRVYDPNGTLAHIESQPISNASCSVAATTIIAGPIQPPAIP